jgi:segregation and condensation protein B
MAFNLKRVLRALLFSSNQPLAIKDIQAAFTRFHEADQLPLAAAPGGEGEGRGAEEVTETAPAPASAMEEAAELVAEPPADPELYSDVPSLVTATQIREVMDEIAVELRQADQGLLLIDGASGYRLVTDPRFARWVRILRSDPPPLKLSPSSLETLAVVAYRQPVTRGEIEAIRGVSAEAGINKLIERELIYITGRADLPGRPLQYATTDHFLEFIGIKSVDELPASDVLSTRQLDDWLQNAMNPTKLGDAEMGLPGDEQLSLDAAPAEATAPADGAPPA